MSKKDIEKRRNYCWEEIIIIIQLNIKIGQTEFCLRGDPYFLCFVRNISFREWEVSFCMEVKIIVVCSKVIPIKIIWHTVMWIINIQINSNFKLLFILMF